MTQQKKADLVLEGGGVRGIGLVGALSVLEKDGYTFVNIAGTSAGAVVAALLGAGYTADELEKIIAGIGFDTFVDPLPLGHIPLVGPLINETFQHGLYKGEKLESLIRKLLAEKGIHTFGDLTRPGINDPRYRFRVQMIASDISKRRMLVLPGAVQDYGLKPEDLDVAFAVRMSIGIPFFFTPIKLSGSYIVDGGILSNFPVELFDTTDPDHPTFGIKLVASDQLRADPTRVPQMHLLRMMPRMIRNPVDEAIAVVFTAIEAHDAYALERAKSVRTITVDTLDIKSVDFNLSPSQKMTLYASGEKTAQAFLKDWNFSAYIAEFRTPTPAQPGKIGSLPGGRGK